MPNHRSTASRCTMCRLRAEMCVCAHAPRLRISTRLIVIMHSKEWRRISNTGQLVRVAIEDAQVRLHGLPQRIVSDEGIDPASSSTLALYPGRGASILTPASIASLPRPVTLLVPDGNWMQTKNMMRRVPMLQQAQPVRVDGPILQGTGLRRNCYADRMSTFEAIALALGILEGRETQERLFAFFARFLGQGKGTTMPDMHRSSPAF